jgi:hypothetical protein
MVRKFFVPVLALSVALAGCDKSPTALDTAQTQAALDDYAMVMFGQDGAALAGTMGRLENGHHRFDGGSAFDRLPDSLALTTEQTDSIQALRAAFAADHQAALDSLHTIFAAARTAREGGATREEVRAILMDARPIAMAIRMDVRALREAIWAVLTDAQRAWLADHHRRCGYGAPIARP